MIVRMKSNNGISSSWFGLIAGSTVGTMIVSVAVDVVLFVFCAVAVTLCVLWFHWPSDLFVVCT